MRRAAAGEILPIGDGRTDERPLHHIGIEDEVAQQHAGRKDEQRAVRRQHAGRGVLKMVEIHRRGDEPVEKRHQYAGHHRQHDALAAVRVAARTLLHSSRSDAVADDRRHDQRHADEQNHRIAFRRTRIVDDHAENQREAHAQRECDGHAGQRGRGGEQDIRCVEDHAAQQCARDIGSGGLSQILQERPAFGTEAPHRQRKDQREEEHADHIVPVEEFVTPGFGGHFLGVAPGAPAQHRHETEDDGQCVTVDNKHRLKF